MAHSASAIRLANQLATEPHEEPEEHWLLSYLDVFALIATLFIVLTVLAQLKLQQHKEQQQAAQQQQQAEQLKQQQQLQDMQTDLRQTRQQLAVLNVTAGNTAIAILPAALQALLADHGWNDEVMVRAHDDYTELQIRDRVLFPSAEAELLPEGQILLTRLVPVLQQTPGRIYIEGHTDNEPITTTRFNSNWELAAARATNVLQFFVAHGIAPRRLRAVSVAETDPIASNATETGRAQNRRVSLLIRRDERATQELAQHDMDQHATPRSAGTVLAAPAAVSGQGLQQ